MSTPIVQGLLKAMPFGLQLISRAPTALVPTRAKTRVNGHTTTLNLREGIQRAIYFDVYEAPQTEWFKRCVKPGDVVVDVGASFGYYTSLAASLVGPLGKVYAFEPSPLPEKAIEEMIANSPDKNIVLSKAALGSEKGELELFIPNGGSIHSPSILPSGPDFTPVKIVVNTLDAFAEENGVDRINLLKIDVEGFEPDVIRGMPRLIAERRVENIVCEFNSGWLARNNTTPQALCRHSWKRAMRSTKRPACRRACRQTAGNQRIACRIIGSRWPKYQPAADEKPFGGHPTVIVQRLSFIMATGADAALEPTMRSG